MAVSRTSLVALVLVCTTCYCSQPPVSARDQYEAREDWSHPPQLHSEATDQSFKAHKSHRFSLPLKKSPDMKTDHTVNDVVPDLQVGCGDGFIVESTTAHKNSKKHETSKLRRRRSVDDSARKRRHYFPLTHVIRTPASISYSVWQPPVYQLTRPYYIPMWGTGGKAPLFYPPQPLLINPGFPQDNPPPVRGYLPIPTTTSKTTTAETMTFPSRSNDDDRPVWGSGAASSGGSLSLAAQRPAATTTRSPPTRRTVRPGETSTHPPFVHIVDGEDNSIQQEIQQIFSSAPAAPPSPVFRTTTARPVGDRRPLNCVFAIISCCSAGSKEINYNCFEQRGCPGPFWDTNPCDRNFANAAINSASDYFNARK